MTDRSDILVFWTSPKCTEPRAKAAMPEEGKRMKKWISLLLAAVLAVSAVGCGAASGQPASDMVQSAPSGAEGEPEQPTSTAAGGPLNRPLNIGALRGPTAMGMVRLMQNAETGAAALQYEFQITGAADELVPLLARGELDAAALPANLAANLAEKAGLQVAAINTLGVLYLVTTSDSIETLEDLRGSTLLSTGKGTTPEYVLNYLLAQNGMSEEDLTIEYKSEAAEVLAALEAGQASAAILPQPYVTTALAKLEGLRVALDLTAEWDRVSPDSALVTGVLVVRREFAEQYPEAVRQLLADYEQSVSWVQQNTADAAALIENYGIVPSAAIAEQALPACNIVWITGEEMKRKLSGYLAVLYAQDPASVGGAEPAGSFYYGT